MEQRSRPYGILSIATALPPHRLTLLEYEHAMAAALASEPALARWLLPIAARSGVDCRYFAVPGFLTPESRFSIQTPWAEAPTTTERMAVYREEAPRLGTDAALRVFRQEAERTGSTVEAVAASITHVVVVSGTGAASPGLDVWLTQRLGLSPNVGRTVIGYMGCYAGLTGLRQSAHIVAGDPDARVLLVAVELNSMHVQHEINRENLFPLLMFSDGAAACLVGTITDAHGDVFTLDRFRTLLVPGTADEITICMGTHGQHFHLSSRVPLLIVKSAPPEVEACMEGRPLNGFCAIHPGGRAIIDGLEQRMKLNQAQVAPSRAVLRDYGNTSAAAILFVLAEVRNRLRESVPAGGCQEGLALSFGPGLTIELSRLTYVAPAASKGTGSPRGAELHAPGG